MTWTKVTQTIVAIAAVGALLVSIYSVTRVGHVEAQVEIVHVSINSRMTELLELTRKASRAEGVKMEKERLEQIPN